MKGKLNCSFILITQAARAEVELFHFPVNRNRGWVDITEPAPVGMTLGVADIGPINGAFTANIALQFGVSPLVSRYEILQNLPIHSNIMQRHKQELHPWLT